MENNRDHLLALVAEFEAEPYLSIGMMTELYEALRDSDTSATDIIATQGEYSGQQAVVAGRRLRRDAMNAVFGSICAMMVSEYGESEREATRAYALIRELCRLS